MKKLILLALVIIAFHPVSGQDPNWKVLNTDNSGLTDNELRCLAIDEGDIKWIGTINEAVFTFDNINWDHYNQSNSFIYDTYILSIKVDAQNNKWIGTRGAGMVRFNGSDWTLYDEIHSDIPDDKVSDIAFENNLVWVATQHGLGKYDGTNWTNYTEENSEIPDEEVRGITIDNQGNKWIATWGGGAAKFDGTDWVAYNENNAGFPTGYCVSIFFDGTHIWVGTSNKGLMKYDGSTWTLYTKENSPLPHNTVTCFKKEGDKMWFTTVGGVATLKDDNWTVYTSENSDLPDDICYAIEIDQFGNKWIATKSGLAEFNEGGIIGIHDNPSAANTTKLYQNTPNPFSITTTIRYELDRIQSVSLEIFDLTGNKIASLDNGQKSSGTYEVVFKNKGMTPGLYFYQLRTGNSVQIKKLIIQK